MGQLHGTGYGEGSDQTFWQGRKNFQQRFDRLEAHLQQTNKDLQKVKSDVKSLHTKVSSTEQTADNLNRKVELLENKLSILEERGRRDNLLILGLKEKSKGENARAFLTNMIPKWFPSLSPSITNLEIMRARRVGKPERRQTKDPNYEAPAIHRQRFNPGSVEEITAGN